jgi:hypothetical protein
LVQLKKTDSYNLRVVFSDIDLKISLRAKNALIEMTILYYNHLNWG